MLNIFSYNVGMSPISCPRRFAAATLLATLSLLSVGGVAHAAAPDTGFAACSHNFYQGQPPTVVSDGAPGARRALCFSEFAVLHSGQTRTPLFVAQKLDPAQLNEIEPFSRSERFYEEARLPARERATLSSYKHSGFDRGHLAPAADMRTAEGTEQSFSLANIVPQAPLHNRKAWKKIEQDTRKYVKRAKHPVYVITGAHFERIEGNVIGSGFEKKVAVPSALYKLVIDPARNRAWAHWLENHDDARPGAPISIEALSQRTGVQFSRLSN